jgi:nucleoside-diphosphate-sugar epimerase
LSASLVITGASGFLGRHLIARFLGEGRDVVALTRDAARLDDLSHPRLRVIATDYGADLARIVGKDDTILHLAAQRNMPTRHAASFRWPNVELPGILARLGPERFVYVSTALATAAGPRSAYLASRVEGLARMNGVTTVLPSIIFGPDHPRAPNRIARHIRALLRRPFRIGIAGEQAPRNMIFVDDVVNAIARMESGLVTGENVTQDELERQVYAAAGRKPAPRIVIPRGALQMAARTLDAVLRFESASGWCSRVETLLAPWCFPPSNAYTPFAEGVRRTVEAI